MGECRWRLEERFALGWRQETEGSEETLEVGGTLRFRLEAEGRRQRAEVGGQKSEIRGQRRLKILDCRS
jgi:hypothetical protein